MSVAELGIKITTSGVNEGRLNLEKLAGTAGKVEKATGTMSVQASKAMRAIGATSPLTETLNRGLERTERAVRSTTTALDLETAAVNRSTAALRARNSAATASANFNTANVAAQFQDIGVTAAMGMSPMMIALQQGTQLSAALGTQGLTGTVKMLGAAFASILSPVSLLTIGVVALGTAGIQALMGMQKENQTAAEMLEAHQTALEGIVQGYKAAEDAIDGYAAGLNRLPRSIAVFELNAQFDQIAEDINEVTAQAAKFGNLFVGYGSQAEQAFGALSRQFAEGEISAEDFYLGLQDVKTQLNAVESALSGISVAKLIAEMEEGALKAVSFGNAINNLVAQSHALAGLAVDPTLQTYFETQEEEKKKAKKPRSGGANPIDQWAGSVTSFQQRIDSQRLELQLMGQSTYEVERQKAAFDLLNQAKQAGIPITSSITDQINSMSAQYATATTALEQYTEAQREWEQNISFAKGTVNGFLGDLRAGMSDGVLGWDDWANAGVNALNRIADRAMTMAVDGIFDMIFGAAFGGAGGSMGANSQTLPWRAA